MKLSIIIPVFNEEGTILKVLNQLLVLKLPTEKEIIVVDDGSIDHTVKILTKYQVNKELTGLKIIFHKKNLGKGMAVRTGIGVASGEYILIQDADLEYNPSEIKKMLRPILTQSKKENTKKGIAIYGSRFISNNAIIPPLYLFGNKLLTFLTNLLYGVKLTDMETGYKLLPALFLKRIKLKSKHFDIEPEITAKVIQNGLRIIEVPISYKGRTHLAGKKLTVIDAFEAIKALIYWRFVL